MMMMRTALHRMECRLVVVVMTEQENVEWCRQNLQFSRRDGVQRTICANAHGKRCRGEIVDMFALSLGDYLIVVRILIIYNDLLGSIRLMRAARAPCCSVYCRRRHLTATLIMSVYARMLMV